MTPTITKDYVASSIPLSEGDIPLYLELIQSALLAEYPQSIVEMRQGESEDTRIVGFVDASEVWAMIMDIEQNCLEEFEVDSQNLSIINSKRILH